PVMGFEFSAKLPKRPQLGRWVENIYPLVGIRVMVEQIGVAVMEIKTHAKPSSRQQFSLGHACTSQTDPIPRGELPPRSWEVLRLVASGHANKQIADLLGISIKTVELHR